MRSTRDPDFFEFLRYQAETTITLIHESKPDQIDGVCTFTGRNGYLHGKKSRVGYIGDLRLGFDRGCLKIWRKCFETLLSTAPETRELGCRYFLMAVIDSNKIAVRALVNSPRTRGFSIEPLSSYRMVNVISRLPWAKRAKSERVAQVTRATPKDQDSLIEFLNRQNQAKAFGYDFGPQINGRELERRLKIWDNFKLTDFWIARDPRGEILGCLAPWTPTRAKRNLMDGIPFYLRILKGLIPIPERGKELKTIYLTHLEIERTLRPLERREIFRQLFDRCYEEIKTKEIHTVSFCDFSSNEFHAALSGYFKQLIPMTLYVARHDSTPKPAWVAGEELEPGFEIALV